MKIVCLVMLSMKHADTSASAGVGVKSKLVASLFASLFASSFCEVMQMEEESKQQNDACLSGSPVSGL